MASRTLVFSALFFLLFPLAAFCEAQAGAVRHSLDITIDIPGRSMTGVDTMTFDDAPSEAGLIMRKGSEVTRVSSGDLALAFETAEGKDYREITVIAPAGKKLRKLTVHFKGSFLSPVEAQGQIIRGVAYLDDGVIGEEGVFLPSSALWYPNPGESFATFEAKVTIPKGYASIMQGTLEKKREDASTVTEKWVEWKPIDGIDLVAGRYRVEKDTHRGIAIYTYFFDDDKALSRTYIDRTKEYLDLYSALIGPYPYGKFAVVENFLPTGYGMPSFTLLGSSVLRLPFIPYTSLGHEIAHSWWGNSVFIDSSLGNWSEALTTYLSDYLYEKMKGPDKAREFRAAKLRGYKNFAEKSQLPLGEFRDATGTESRTIGYNKGVMVFNMLEEHLGDKTFTEGLRRFYSENASKRATWADIQASFEAASGRSLAWFFDQWLKNPGGPSLKLDGVEAKKTASGYSVTFRVEQTGRPYSLDLPVLFETESGPVWKSFRIERESNELVAELPSRPLSMEIDPGFQNFRILSDAETPPSFAGFFGDRESLIVLPNKNAVQEKYLPAADLLATDYGLRTITDAEIGRKDYTKDHSVFIFGGAKENRLYWLTGQHFTKKAAIGESSFEVAGQSFERNGAVLVLSVRNPADPSKTICLFLTDLGREAALDAARRIRYFTDSSWLVFTPDGRAEKGIFKGEATLRHEFK